MYANNYSVPFVLGYSRYTGSNSMRYFWDYTGSPDLDATLLVFVDQCPSREDVVTAFEKEDIYPIKIQFNLKTNIMKISYELLLTLI
jgi:hypothetical protein